ncbi:MAG TPA: hypothetical protein VG273_11750 [Bryobacteraceae bacterium]|jgi:hypothetical protein|nr:hypothetical protein [Bryobacteraceae bacterium]
MAKQRKAAKKASAQPIKHVVSAAEIEASPELEAAGVKAGDEIGIEIEDDVPSFTIRADSLFGIRAMISVAGIASMLPAEEQAAIAAKLREFDLYEEANR